MKKRRDAFDLGPEPTWLTCPCGQETNRVPCWDCQRAEDARVDATKARVQAIEGLPVRFQWAHLGAPELQRRVATYEPVKVLARRVLAARNAIFCGTSGTGKTSLAVACLRERLPHGVFVPSWLLATARIQFAAGQGEASIVERAMRAPLLLIDEVGGEQPGVKTVRDVVFARHDADLPTWITTGFSEKILGGMYGDGFLRRVAEDAEVVNLGPAADQDEAAQ